MADTKKDMNVRVALISVGLQEAIKHLKDVKNGPGSTVTSSKN